jgi:HK97 family phage prohead protease
MERRFVSSVELRASQGDEGSMVISGRAASFGTLSENLGRFKETIQRGAFARSLQSDRDVKANFNHGEPILGRKKNGTLRVTEDDRGLNFRAILPNTQAASDVFRLVSERYADSCSFAFEIDPGDEGDEPGESWSEITDPETNQKIGLRTLRRVKLHDVSVLSGSPAYPTGTSVEVDALRPSSLDCMPRSLSLSDYFPTGVPQSFPTELRAKIMTDAEARFRVNNSRKRVLDFILS